MPDATITWKGAVPFDALVGQAEHVGALSAERDPRFAAAGFIVKPFHSSNVESAMPGAVPYVSANEFVPEGEDPVVAIASADAPKPKRGK